VGQSTDVALLNVLDVFGLPDQRQVSVHPSGPFTHSKFTRDSKLITSK
jgi:hypothetical protein